VLLTFLHCLVLRELADGNERCRTEGTADRVLHLGDVNTSDCWIAATVQLIAFPGPWSRLSGCGTSQFARGGLSVADPLAFLIPRGETCSAFKKKAPAFFLSHGPA
jgi:hypothetical protein